MMKKLLLYIFLFCALTASAQDTISVQLKGRVIDEKNDPVSFCLIRIEGQAAGTTADIDGKYTISFQSADTVIVSYSMLGYEKKTKQLRRPRGKLTLNVVLQTSGKEMGEVEVKDVKRNLTTTETLNTSQMRQMPSTSGNAVEELVSTQAGVSTHNELSSQYNVRGGSFDENNVYINGVEVFRPLLIHSGEQEGLSVINPDMVNQVDFSAGGFSAKYGDKMSSVLDIKYKKPMGWDGHLSASLLGASAYCGYGNKKFSFSNGFRYKTNQYLLGALETEGEYKPSFLDYQAYLSWQPHPKWTVDVIGYVSRNSYKFIPETRETSFGTLEDVHTFEVYFDGWEQDLFTTLFGTAQVHYEINKNHKVGFSYSAFSTNERETYDIQGQYWLDDTQKNDNLNVATFQQHARNLLNSTQHAVKLDYDGRIKKHHLEAGIGYRHEYVTENSREWEFRDSSKYSMPHTGKDLYDVYNMKSVNEISSDLMEMFLMDTYRNESNYGILSVNYGARFSYWSWNKEFLASPRVSIGYVPGKNDNFTFRLATGLYYQRPYYKELRDTTTVDGNTVVTLNRDIKSQMSFQVVLGMDYKFQVAKRPFRFSTELYYKLQDKLNPYNIDNVKIVYYGRNCAKGYVVGADFKLYGEFVPGYESWITFSLMKAQMKIGDNSFPQPNDQTWSLNMFFTDYFPHSTRWKLNLRANFAGGLPFGAPHTGLETHVFRAPAYKRVDLGMSYRVLKNEDRHLHNKYANTIKNFWIEADCLNVFGFENVSGYFWVADSQNQQFAVPNYLTGRTFNLRFSVEF